MAGREAVPLFLAVLMRETERIPLLIHEWDHLNEAPEAQKRGSNVVDYADYDTSTQRGSVLNIPLAQ